MADVVPFKGGKRCIECDEQIDPRRVRAQPNARKCIKCARAREGLVQRTLKNALLREKSVVVIRW